MQWTRASVLGFALFFYDTQMHEICGTKNLGPTIEIDILYTLEEVLIIEFYCLLLHER